MKAGNHVNIKWRAILLYVCFVFFAVAILFKIANIQYQEGDKWRALADSILIKSFQVPAERGNLITENGTVLATSIPIYNIALDLTAPALRDSLKLKINELTSSLAKICTDYTAEEYKAILTKGLKEQSRYTKIAKGVTYSQLQLIKNLPLVRTGKYKGGLIVETKQKRIMPFGSLALRTIGYTKDTTEVHNAKSIGLEAYYDNILKGVDGVVFKQKVSSNVWKIIDNNLEIEPRNGQDIVTTLDIKLQAYADTALRKKMTEKGAERGCLILMETKTGKIRAMVNLLKQKDSLYHETHNFAINEAQEPGSTFKLASMLSMLDDNIIDTTDQIGINGGTYMFHSIKMTDSHSSLKNVYNVCEVFEQSSNVGTARLVYNAYNNNPMQFIRHLQKYHFTEKLGIDLYGEAKPFVTTPDNKQLWSAISLPWLAIGYGVQIAPIHTLAFYNAVANGGKMMKPYLVSEVQEDGKTIQKFEPTVLEEQIASPEAIKIAKALCENVVKFGTAKAIYSDVYSIGGKTGTAKVSSEGNYKAIHYQASFAGFFPVENPVYSCVVVMISKNPNFYYGGQLSAPVFKELANKAIAHYLREQKDTKATNDTLDYNIKKHAMNNEIASICKMFKIKSEQDTKLFSEWVFANGIKTGIRNNEAFFSTTNLPNVVGMSLKDAVYLLEQKGFQVRISGTGRIREQSIDAGTSVARGTLITLQLS